MASNEHLTILNGGTDRWNQWRKDHPSIKPDLEGADLLNKTLSGVNFSDTILRGANLNGAHVEKSNLVNADLRNVTAKAIDLDAANLNGAILEDGDFERAHLTQCTLKRCNLQGVDFSRADLTNANLSESDARRSNFQSANLSKSKLQNIHFQGALLSTGNFTEALLTGSNLDGADLGENEILIDFWTNVIAQQKTISTEAAHKQIAKQKQFLKNHVAGRISGFATDLRHFYLQEHFLYLFALITVVVLFVLDVNRHILYPDNKINVEIIDKLLITYKPENTIYFYASYVAPIIIDKIFIVTIYFSLISLLIKNINLSKHNSIVEKRIEHALNNFPVLMESVNDEEHRNGVLRSLLDFVHKDRPTGFEKIQPKNTKKSVKGEQTILEKFHSNAIKD